MSKGFQTLEISHIPELVKIAEEVQTSGKSKILRRNKAELAVLSPVQPARKTPSRARPVTREDALFRLVGIGKSGIPGGISTKKHEYLVKAHRSTHR